MLWQRKIGSTPLMDTKKDHLVVLQIDGMHCHRCEKAIQRALGNFPGVREVEVDFLSGQASVLHEHGAVTAQQMMDAVNEAGYKATGYIEKELDAA